jgi:hypothetical protein
MAEATGHQNICLGSMNPEFKPQYRQEKEAKIQCTWQKLSI